MIELEQAIADIQEARLTHVHWAEHFERHPEAEKDYIETGEWDSAKIHREWEAKYDRVLIMLERLRTL